ILTGLMGVSLASGAARRTGLIVAGSVLAGLAATAVIQGWLDVVEGDWAANAAALSLTVLAIAAVVAGFEALLGKAGAVVAALIMVLIGNPFSGVGSAPELLPQPVGGIGQLLPPGAGGNLLRSTGFFDGAAAGEHALVLAIWAAAGLLALAVAAARGTRLGTAPAGSPA
ncbi:MAG: ABC transporter permease, partial [Thermoleophilaceae bacterium]